LLMAQHAAEVQRIEVARIGREDGAVDLLCLAEPPLLVQRQRLGDGMCRRRALPGCVLRHTCVTRSLRWDVNAAKSAKMVNRT